MGGLAYHVLNRAAGQTALFETPADYEAFERVLEQAWTRQPTRILCYCVMPNHWHLVLWPQADDELSEFVRWLTVTHTQRWRAHRPMAGGGPLYQGRFKSFPIQPDDHLLRVCRYVERNALRANLVERAEQWPWCSLWRRRQARGEEHRFLWPEESWPVAPPRNWVAVVNRAESPEELEALRRSLTRGAPFGTETWQARTAAKLDLESTLRPRGRPKRLIQKGGAA